MRRGTALGFLATVLVALIAAEARAETVSDLFDQVHRSVVVVRAVEVDVPSEEGQAPTVSSTGSGVLISADGKISPRPTSSTLRWKSWSNTGAGSGLTPG